jgi:hypothetical protein
VAPTGWKASSGSLTTTVFTGQNFFKNETVGQVSSNISLPLSYPMRSNGRPLGITSVRLCRTTTNATITSYGIVTGSGSSAANGGNSVSVSKTGAGCDDIDIASLNDGQPFDANGGITLDLVVSATFQPNGGVSLGGPQLTLVPG